MPRVHLWAGTLAVLLVAVIPVSHATVSILCSGGGVRSALGCGMAIALIKQQDPTLFADVRNIRGISGGAWGIALAALANDGGAIRRSAHHFGNSGSRYGPKVSGMKHTKAFYSSWKKQIFKYFVAPFSPNTKTFTQFASAVATSHPNINFDILVAGVDHQKYTDAEGWCRFSTSNKRIECYKSSTINTLEWHADAGPQKLSQLLSLSSSAASTMKTPKALRKFPKFDFPSGTPNTGVPFKYLIDAGHFNNLPFVPFVGDNKVITFDFTQNANPLVCFARFAVWANTNAPSEELEPQFLFLLKDGRIAHQPFTVPTNPNTILFIFRTKTSPRRYYYNYPFIGHTKKFDLMKDFPTMVQKININNYDLKAVNKYIDEYFEGFLDNFLAVMRTIKADPTTLPWPGTASTTTIPTTSLTDSFTDSALDFFSDDAEVVSSDDETDYTFEEDDQVEDDTQTEPQVLRTNN